MDDRMYRFLKITAILLTVVWVGWSAYDSFFRDTKPGDTAYFAANKLFEDGQYARALNAYNQALQQAPDHVYALRGKAQSLLQLGRYGESLEAFNSAIQRDPQFAASYANRGILYDRMGRYEKAIEDYEHALRLDSHLADGPNWLTRFLRLQPEKPPTIADRARYLREELDKPEKDRLLRVPETDQQQRPYQM
jgi:tetratricopeptide (TPR) repeat protein